MPCFVLSKQPNGVIYFIGNFTDRVEALVTIRRRLEAKSLMASACTYTIHSWEGCETFNEDNLP